MIELVDCEKRHEETGGDFDIPGEELRTSLRIDDHAKVIANGERFWVRITGTEDKHYLGEISNELVGTDKHGLTLGDKIRFEPKHICQVLKARE